MSASAVKTLQNDLQRYRSAQKRETAARTAVKKAQATHTKDVSAQKQTLADLASQKQNVLDLFESAPTKPLTTEDSQKLLQQLFDLGQKEVQTRDSFARKLASDRSAIAKDQKAVTKDHQSVKADHQRALKDLRPAEYKLGLKATNAYRKDLGLKAVDKVVRPPENLNTVKGCAQFLLKSPNVSFWSGLSSGSDRKNVERLANGEKAYVPATGGYVTPKLKLMQALVAMAKAGRVQINALTGGVHTPGSNHYKGEAVDLELTVGNPSQLVRIANKYGGVRNSETTHIHLDFLG